MSKSAMYFLILLTSTDEELNRIMLAYDLIVKGLASMDFNDEQMIACEAMLALAED